MANESKKEQYWTSRHPNEAIFDMSQFDTLHTDEWDDKSIGRIGARLRGICKSFIF